MNSKKITGIILLVALLVIVSIAPVYARTYDVTFDSDYYANTYADLKRAFGNDEVALRNHFLNYGIKEGRQGSAAFDVRYYLETYKDLQRAFGNDNYQAAYNHFVKYGINEGRQGSASFDVKHYLANYPDLQRAFGNDNYQAAYNHFVAYGINEERTADHVYGEAVITNPATCTTAGEKTFTCTVCGDVKTEEIPALGHSLTKTEASPATCIKEGNKEYYTCDACQKIYSDAEGTQEITIEDTVEPKTEHTYGEAVVTKPETCTTAGEKTFTCTVCGDVKTEEIPAAHSFTQRKQLKEPTCTEDGSYIMICDREDCAAVEPEVDEEGNIVLDENGKTVNKIYVDEKLGHNFAEKRFLKEPTCTEDGSYLMVCDREGCGAVEQELNEEGNLVNQIYTEPKLGHTFVKDENGEDKVITKDATCEKDGYELKICSVCGETVSTVLPKLEHDYGTPVFTWNEDNTATAEVICANNNEHKETLIVTVTSETTPAACGVAGETVYTATATYNDETYTDTKTVEITALEHVWNGGVVTDLENGDSLKTYTCNTCGDTKTETIHNHLVTYKTLKEATCAEPGLDAQICLNCNETVETKTIKGHDEVLVKTDANEATCTEPGNSEYWTCASCGKHFDAETEGNEITLESTVIPALEHSLTKTDANEATCDTDGNIEYYTCDNCSKIYSDAEGTKEITIEDTVIPAAHTLTAHEANEATCTAAGNEAYWTCSECNKIFKDAEATEEFENEAATVIEAKPHELTAHEANEATCTKAGNQAYWTCANCDKIFKDENGTEEFANLAATVIEANGHDEVLVKVEANEATCTTPGNIEYWKCESCGQCFDAETDGNEITLESTVTTKAHDLTKTEASPATCEAAGNKAYWTCSECNKIFKDAEATEEFENLAATVIKALGHEWEVVGTKAACEYATLTCLNKDCEYYGKEVNVKTLIDEGKMSQEDATAAGYVPTMAHDIDTIMIQEPTAEHAGLATDHCSICHKDIRVKYEVAYVAPLEPGV